MPLMLLELNKTVLTFVKKSYVVGVPVQPRARQVNWYARGTDPVSANRI